MFALTRKRKIAILVIVDCLLIVLANFLAYLFMKPFVPITESFVMVSAGLSVGLYLIFGFVFRVFTRINRYTNLREMIAIFLATTSQTVMSLILLEILFDEQYSRVISAVAFCMHNFYEPVEEGDNWLTKINNLFCF